MLKFKYSKAFGAYLGFVNGVMLYKITVNSDGVYVSYCFHIGEKHWYNITVNSDPDITIEAAQRKCLTHFNPNQDA